MGSKRIGLARFEALLEAVDRDLNLANSTLTNCTITTDQNCTFSGTTVASGELRATGNLKLSSDLINHGQTVNQMSLFGLNPIWAFNFGDPSVAASATEAGAKATVLTPIGTLFNLSLALAKFANQDDELTVAESTELLGSTAQASTSAAIAAGATSVIMPDDLNVTRVTGNVGSSLTLTASTVDYQANESALMIFKGGNVFAASQFLKLTMHTDAELNAEGTEVIVSGAGTNNMTRSTVPTDADAIIILTASGAETTIVEGSYIYVIVENNTDVVNIKACIRTTGGTIAVTYAS